MRPIAAKNSRAVVKSLTRQALWMDLRSPLSCHAGTEGSRAATSSAESGATPPSHGLQCFCNSWAVVVMAGSLHREGGELSAYLMQFPGLLDLPRSACLPRRRGRH